MPYAYPYKKYNYKIIVDLKEVADFSEISARDVTMDPIEYREGTPSIKQPGLVKYGNITLRLGRVIETDLMKWLQSTTDGTCERKTIIIQFCNDLQNVVAEWKVINAYPIKYTQTDFDTTSHVMTIESVELAHEGILHI